MKFKDLWIVLNANSESKIDPSTAVEALCYFEEPRHGAIHGLTTHYKLAEKDSIEELNDKINKENRAPNSEEIEIFFKEWEKKIK